MFQILQSRKLDLVALIFLLVLILVVFWKTIILGAPISRICGLVNHDFLFHDFATSKELYYDPSPFSFLYPYLTLVASSWQQGVLPFWNPYQGTGCPLAADPVSYFLSPFTIIFTLCPTLHTYNLLLIVRVLLAAMSTYFFGKALRLGRLPSFFAALIYAFCPFNLWYAEMSNGTTYPMLPLLFASFAKLAQTLQVKWLVWCTLACALVLLSGHSECVFFDITIATFFFLAQIFFLQPQKRKQLKFYLTGLLAIGAIGLVSFCLSAPALLPFLEYLFNLQTYKTINYMNTHAHPLSLLFNLFFPLAGPASPSLGIVAFTLVLLAIIKLHRPRIASLAATAILTYAIVSQLGPLDYVFNSTFFHAITTAYAMPVLILLLSMLSGYGLKAISVAMILKNRRTIIWFAFLCFFILAIPAILYVNKYPTTQNDFDCLLPPMAVKANWLVCNLISITGALIAVLVAATQLKRHKVFFILLCIGTTSFLGQAAVFSRSMPVQPSMNFKEIPFLSKLISTKARVSGFKVSVMRPDTNIIYKINSLESEGALFPERYLKFMRAAGSKPDPFYVLIGNHVDQLLNAASLKYIYSAWALPDNKRKESTLSSITTKFQPQVILSSQVSIQDGIVHYDPINSEVIGKVTWQANPFSQYLLYTVVLDYQGKPAWFNTSYLDEDCIEQVHTATKPQQETGNRHCTTIGFFVPPNLPGGKKFIVGIEIFDKKAGKFLSPCNSVDWKIPEASFVVPLGSFKKVPWPYKGDKSTTDLGQRRFQLLFEDPKLHCRIYENKDALPPAYVAYNTVCAHDGAQALKLITQCDLKKCVVLEPDSKIPTSSYLSNNTSITAANVLRPDVNTVIASFNTSLPGYLVLTDTYYPGWHAYVDGQKSKILRANYLFRAVAVPAGNHTVEFKFEPASFWAGVVLFILGATVTVWSLLCCSNLSLESFFSSKRLCN